MLTTYYLSFPNRRKSVTRALLLVLVEVVWCDGGGGGVMGWWGGSGDGVVVWRCGGMVVWCDGGGFLVFVLFFPFCIPSTCQLYST